MQKIVALKEEIFRDFIWKITICLRNLLELNFIFIHNSQKFLLRPVPGKGRELTNFDNR